MVFVVKSIVCCNGSDFCIICSWEQGSFHKTKVKSVHAHAMLLHSVQCSYEDSTELAFLPLVLCFLFH